VTTDAASQSSGSPHVLLFAFQVAYLICWLLLRKVLEENGEQVPCYSVMVSLQEVGGAETKNWTVPRRLSEFQNLHRKLSEVQISVRGGRRCRLLKFDSDAKVERGRSVKNLILRGLMPAFWLLAFWS